jgi:MFS family permease
MSILNGANATVSINLTNNYFSLFAISVLGASNYQVGLISSLPALTGMIASIPAAMYVNNLEEKKKMTAVGVLFTRLFLFLMALVPMVPHHFATWFLILLIALMNMPGTFVNIAWQAFIGDLIPENRRSMFFSARNKITTIVGMFTTLIVGIVMTKFNKINPSPYQTIFVIAFLFGLLELYFLMKHKEQKTEKDPSVKTNIISKEVFKHKPYLYFLICGLFFNFAWQMSWSLFNIYQVKTAHATALWISLFVVANQLTQVLTFTWWGNMANKHGNVKMLIYVSLGMATAPFLTMLSTNLIYLVIVNLLTGAFVSGTVLLLFNTLLETSKKENRTVFIANYNFLLAFVAFIAPQFGVYLLETYNMNIAMNTSTVLRALSALFFLWMLLKLKKA